VALAAADLSLGRARILKAWARASCWVPWRSLERYAVTGGSKPQPHPTRRRATTMQAINGARDALLDEAEPQTPLTPYGTAVAAEIATS